MNKRRLSGFGLALVLIAGLFAAVAPAASAQDAPARVDPPGNNGTVKIHEGNGEPSPIMQNQPHVCSFHVHAFNFDSDQALTYSIYEWAPTAPVKGTEVTSGTITTDTDGAGRTTEITLADGHYRLVVDTGNGTPTQDKHKMFWVDCPSAQPQTGQLVITKHWVDNTPGATTPTFGFTYECGATSDTISTDEDFDVDGTTATAVVQGLAPGTSCTVSELTTQGWDWDTTVNGQPGTSTTVHIDAGQNATVTFVNTRGSATTPRTGNLVVTKSWSDPAATTTPTFSFAYDCDATTGTLTFPDDFTVNGRTGTATVANLGAGTACTVTELTTPNSGWTTTVNGEAGTSATVHVNAGHDVTVAFVNTRSSQGSGIIIENGGGVTVLPATAENVPPAVAPAVATPAPAVAGVVFEKPAPAPASVAVLGTHLARTGGDSAALAALAGLLLLAGAGLVLAGHERRAVGG